MADKERGVAWGLKDQQESLGPRVRREVQVPKADQAGAVQEGKRDSVVKMARRDQWATKELGVS